MIVRSVVLAVAALLAIGFGCLAHGGQETRIDTFDKKSNRTGYAIVDPQTGRIDFYDVKSNRVGSGRIQTPPPSYTPPPAYPISPSQEKGRRP